MDEYDRMRENARWMWSLGHYPSLAERLEPYAQALVAAAGIGPGVRVLDVAAGDGNLAVAAARRGGGVRLRPNPAHGRAGPCPLGGRWSRHRVGRGGR